MIPVAVVDNKTGRFIEGLGPEDFALWDSRSEQHVESCIVASGPIRLVVVLDQSRSMKRDLPASYQAIKHLASLMKSGDVLSIVTVRSGAEVAATPTPDTDSALRELGVVTAHGSTALYDGIYLGLHTLIRDRAPRKAIVIFSDGGENASKYGNKDVSGLAAEVDARIYAIATGYPFPEDPEWAGIAAIRTLAANSGGQFFHAAKPGEVLRAAERIDPGRYYLIAYRPTHAVRSGEKRKIEVRLRGRRGAKDLRVFWRRSYIAPER